MQKVSAVKKSIGAENFAISMIILRKKLGLSLRDLAEKVNMTATALSNYKNRKREPTLSSACTIAEALGTNIGDMCKEWRQE